MQSSRYPEKQRAEKNYAVPHLQRALGQEAGWAHADRGSIIVCRYMPELTPSLAK